MLVSIFTPTHNTQYLLDSYKSLKVQTYQNWEWIIVLNNGASFVPQTIKEDLRVRIYDSVFVRGVGEAKNIACSYAQGDILLELDHDDILANADVLGEVVRIFENDNNIVFVYSNTIAVNDDLSPSKKQYSDSHGWGYRKLNNGELECVSFKPHPHNVSMIWYAPNHLRAFRRDAYIKVGGYNTGLLVLDDQDLMARLYLEGEFYHIDLPLYKQREHRNQTQVQPNINQDIQSGTLGLYGKYIPEMMLIWAKRNNLLALDMGAYHNPKGGYSSCDMRDGVDFSFDANEKFPFPDNSVGVIRAVDFLEHIESKTHIIKEIYRVLAHGGMLLSMTPSTDGRGAFQDPTHISFYNENSFWYYTKKRYNNFVEDLDVRFQTSYINTEFPSEWHKENNIPYVIGNLIAIKQQTRDFGGLLEI